MCFGLFVDNFVLMLLAYSASRGFWCVFSGIKASRAQNVCYANTALRLDFFWVLFVFVCEFEKYSNVFVLF